MLEKDVVVDNTPSMRPTTMPLSPHKCHPLPPSHTQGQGNPKPSFIHNKSNYCREATRNHFAWEEERDKEGKSMEDVK